MIKIYTMIDEELEKQNIERPKPAYKAEYTNYLFEMIHPISKVVLTSETMTQADFNGFDYEIKKALKAQKWTETFAEKEYNLAIKEHEKKREAFSVEFERVKKEIMEKINITDAKMKLIDHIIELFDGVDLEMTQDRIDLEEELMELV